MKARSLVLIPIAMTALAAYAGSYDGRWQKDSNGDVYRQEELGSGPDYATMYNGGDPDIISSAQAEDRQDYYDHPASGWQAI